MTFGEKIKKLRNQNNLTQEQFAETLFVTRTAVSKWETNKGLPGIDTLKLISSTFNLSLDELISDDVLECKKLIDKQRAKIMYTIAMVFLALSVTFNFVTYLTNNRLYTIGSMITTIGYIIFGILSRQKYKRGNAKKLIIPYIISRVVVLLFMIGIIIFTMVTL